MITPIPHVAATNTISLSSMTLGQWLGQFEATSTPAQIQQVATALHRAVSDQPADEMDPMRAADFLQRLSTNPDLSGLAPQLSRPLSDFFPLSDGSSQNRLVLVQSPQTWAGQSSDNLFDYLLRTISSRMLPGQRAGNVVYRSDDKAIASALERFRFETLPITSDLVERREAFQEEHGKRLDWAADHARTLLSIVPKETQSDYATISHKVRDLNLYYRKILDALDQVWKNHSNLEPHERNLSVAAVIHQGRKQIEGIRRRIATLDLDWQLNFFDGLMAQARRQPTPPSERDEALFSQARQAFQGSAQTHLNFWEKLIAGEPKTAEHKRKNLEEAAYRALMHREGSLLNVMQEILRRCGHPQAAELRAPLTFVWKSQAYRIAHGPGKMTNAERFVERTANLGGLVDEVYAGKRSLEFLDREIAARSWAIPMMGDFFSLFRLAAPEGAELFTQNVPPELSLILGGLAALTSASESRAAGSGLALFGTPSNPARKTIQRKRRIVSNQNHGDPLDYPAIYMIRYLFGLEPPSIVAESAFNYIPILNKVLRITTGGFLSRGEDTKGKQKRQEFENTLARKIDESRDVTLFGTGTRALGEPLAARYSDLSHLGTLHNPGEFEIPGSMRGMEVRLAMENRADIRIFATNLHRGGIGEPSIPRGLSGFTGRHVTAFGYPSPSPENGFAAYAGEIKFEDLITLNDVPGITIQEINELNTSVEWYLMMRAGLHMDAGPRVS